jgi:hypothetical protein
VEGGSAFISWLNEGFNPDNPELVSIAALDPIPVSFFMPGILPTPVLVVDSNSSNRGNHVYPLHYNHMSIAQITDATHGAYQVIQEFMS